MNPLVIGLAIYLALPYIKGSKTAKALEYFPKRLKYDKATKKLYFVMDVLNPTKNPLKIDSFFGGVYANGKKIGSIEQGTPINIDANKRTEIRLPAVAVGLGIGQMIVDIASGKNIELKVLGIARSMGFDNAINETLSFE